MEHGMEGRVALVTGAAGGIGSAVVRALADRGMVVAAVDRDEEMLGKALAGMIGQGLPVEALVADVSDSAAVNRAVEEVEGRLGPIDYLVNAAGVLRVGEITGFGDDDWRAIFSVNVDGVFHVTRAVVSRMVPRRRGALVTVTSNSAATPRTAMAAYAASKAAATQLTKSVGLEVARYGIRCNLVAPGSTDTAMLRSMSAGGGPTGTIDGDPLAYKVGIPLRKLGMPEDVAAAVLFLLSPDAGHITLHGLTVDGGASLGS
jgi:2,3-dihydro-2,3-dihydroxybenzoate dehydrogenase